MSGCRTEQRVRETIAVFAVVVVVLAIQIIKLMPPGFITDGYALQKRALRVIGRDIGYHRNQVSVWMASGFWLLWIIMTEFKSGALKVASFVAAIVTFYALIMTGSRGGLLTWALAGGVFAWVRWRRLFFIGPIIVVLAVAFIPALQERMTAGFGEEDVAQYDVGDGIESDALDLAAASAGRTILWTYSWPKIEQKIVLGWGGNGMLRSGVSLELWRNYEASMTAGHPHNAYLELMFDVGLLGALIMLSLYFISARKAYRMFKDTELLPRLVGATGIAWVTSYLISGVTASTFYPNEGSIFVWAVMGMVISIGLRQHAPAVSSYRGQHRASPSTS
jgi:O-antigen ligase